MNILSLFDGISCGRVALERSGIKVDKYYASEISEDAIKVSKENYLDIVQLGDITKLDGKQFEGKIDIVIGGSPCQSFSMAGKQEGFGGKSVLYWEFVRILREVKPKYFLLENVRMKKEYQDIITGSLKELFPNTIVHNINSSLVSAQLRNRFYWTNIPNIKQPKDRGVLLQSILENGFTTGIFRDKKLSDYAKERIKGRLKNKEGVCYNWFNDRVMDDKCGTLTASEGWSNKSTTMVIKDNDIRYLTQKELERLQTLPEGYTKILNRNKAASVIGNAWTVDVVSHILSHIDQGKFYFNL